MWNGKKKSTADNNNNNNLKVFRYEKYFFNPQARDKSFKNRIRRQGRLGVITVSIQGTQFFVISVLDETPVYVDRYDTLYSFLFMLMC